METFNEVREVREYIDYLFQDETHSADAAQLLLNEMFPLSVFPVCLLIFPSLLPSLCSSLVYFSYFLLSLPLTIPFFSLQLFPPYFSPLSSLPLNSLPSSLPSYSTTYIFLPLLAYLSSSRLSVFIHHRSLILSCTSARTFLVFSHFIKHSLALLYTLQV